MLEAISLPTMLARPRYYNGLPLDKGRQWSRSDLVALATMCHRKADLEKSALSLGRLPTNIAHYALGTGLKLPTEWYDAIRQKYISKAKGGLRKLRAIPDGPLLYPYIKPVPGQHQEILIINSLVSKGLPGQLRADVCQELMMAVYEGRFTVEEIQAHPQIVREFVTKMRRDNYENNGYALSLDQPMFGDSTRSWYDILPEPERDDEDEPLHSFADLAMVYPTAVRKGDQIAFQDRRSKAALERLKQFPRDTSDIGPFLEPDDLTEYRDHMWKPEMQKEAIPALASDLIPTHKPVKIIHSRPPAKKPKRNWIRP